MHKFLTVLKFELKDYLSSKGFIIMTLALAVLGAGALFLPRFIDMSNVTGVQVVGNSDQNEIEDEVEAVKFMYIDEAGAVQEEILYAMFPGSEWTKAESVAVIESAVTEETIDAGFVVKTPTEFEYYVFNKGMMDNNSAMFEQAMKLFYRIDYCQKNDMDLDEINAMYDIPVTIVDQVLNKDTESNYWYCYILVILVFMMIMMYGQMIAVAVTNEKSNRAIEVLVTSTTPNSLLFGKVIAGAIVGVVQVGLILGSILTSYSFNREVWGGMLDMILNIPAEVLITFAMFGLGGYLFYAFLYGAMGALVSKTEDVSKSSGTLMMIIMIVYFFSLFQLMNIDGPIMKILSFLPFSSYSSMFARIAMGTVHIWEIVVSFLILVVSICGAGVLGAKIYRMGTLRYGNPIKLTTALKDLKKND